jgi:hypothetical protein
VTEEAREVSDAHGLRGWRSRLTGRLATLAALRGDLHRAAGLHVNAIEQAHELGLTRAEIRNYDELSDVHRRLGDRAAARRCHDRARELSQRVQLDEHRRRSS